MMTSPFEEMVDLDRLIHEPARLAVMTALSSCEAADFLYLQRLTGLTKGNLSSHLSKPEEAGLIDIEKRFVGKMPNTLVSLTERGSAAIEQHWRQLDRIRNGAEKWVPEA